MAKLNETVQDALNKQINAEIYSGYIYLAMAAYFTSINLQGFGKWMRIQAHEELGHAMKFFEYITERGGRVALRPLEEPPFQWASPLEAFEEASRHEQKKTGLINHLVELSAPHVDHATSVFLQWFVNEQVEEEASTDEVVQKLKLIGDAPGALFMMDRELGQRQASAS